MQPWLSTAGGVLLVAAALRDVFHTLFHPSAKGRLSQLVMRAVWAGARSTGRPGLRGMSGPLGMIAVVVLWVALVLLGCALVYWPQLPERLIFGSGLEPAERTTLVDAVYVSFVTLVTLGYGDIVPQAAWLRLVMPLEGLVGFGLVTAAVSWVLQVYPALTRRRALALRLRALHRAGVAARVRAGGDPAAVCLVLDGVATQLTQARVDLSQYSATYYFYDRDPSASLAAMLDVAVELAESARDAVDADVRCAGRVLDEALADFAHLVDEEHVHTGGDVREVLGRFGADHGHR